MYLLSISHNSSMNQQLSLATLCLPFSASSLIAAGQILSLSGSQRAICPWCPEDPGLWNERTLATQNFTGLKSDPILYHPQASSPHPPPPTTATDSAPSHRSQETAPNEQLPTQRDRATESACGLTERQGWLLSSGPTQARVPLRCEYKDGGSS